LLGISKKTSYKGKDNIALSKTPSLIGSETFQHLSAFEECAAPPPLGGVGEGLLLSVGLGGVFQRFATIGGKVLIFYKIIHMLKHIFN
jgi:hypothetical protein